MKRPNGEGCIRKRKKPIHAEFIGSIDAMRRQTYYEARIELANHIREKMSEELEEFGGVKAVKKWFEGAMRENIENLYPIFARLYKDMQDTPDCQHTDYHRKDDPEWIKEIRIMKETDPYIKYSAHYNEAKWKLTYWGEKLTPEYYICPITGNRASIWFEFRSVSADDIKHFIGDKELIKPLQNWHSKSYYRYGETEFFYGGNPILDAVDAVDFIEPFAGDRVEFYYYVGFSKRGMNKLIKKHLEETK